jgi:flagellar hook assembly protein FlgD
MAYFGELPSTAAGDQGIAAFEFALAQNQPNPFTNDTQIRFSVPSGGARVTLCVFDVAGRRVRELLSTKVTGGVHTVTWDGADDGGLKTGAGVYFYRLEAPDRKLTKKLVRLQ